MIRSQPTGRCRFAFAVAAVLALAAGTAGAAPGDLDPAFGGNGIVRDAMTGNGAAAAAVAIDASGRIVVAGTVAQNAIDGDLGVLRLNPDGSPDPAFGGSGRVFAGLASGSDEEICGLAIQADGRLVAAGTSFLAETGTRSVALRLGADGLIDDGFGNRGDGWFASTRPGGDVALAFAAGNGGFATGGYVSDGSAGIDAVALRLDSLGMPAPLFGDEGFVLGAPDTNSARAVALQPDGRLLLGGHVDGDGSGAFVQRFAADGSADAAFGGDGRVELAAIAQIGAVALQADGRIVVVGAEGGDAVIVRLLADGSIDPSFGSGGVFVLSAASQAAVQLRPAALAIAGDGGLIVAGDALSLATGAMAFALRLSAAGQADAGFGSGGVRLVDTDTDLQIAAAAVQGDGAIVLAGVDRGETAADGDDRFLVVRLLGTGEPPPAYTLSIADASVGEGDAGTVMMEFTVTLSAPSPGGIGVTAQTDVGSAEPNLDYTPTGTFLTFDEGVDHVVFQVPVIGDLDVEGEETFLARLIDPAGAAIADGVATGTIVDDDVAAPVAAQPVPTGGVPALALLGVLLALVAARCIRSRVTP